MTAKKKEKSRREGQVPEKVEIEKLSGQISDLEKERDELFGKLQRVSADYANYQKRALRQITDSVRHEKEKVIISMLPVMDSLERTLQNCGPADNNMEALRKGIEIIHDQMLGIFKFHGAEQVKAQGEKFDPERHQAMLQRYEPGEDEDTILEVFQTGYKLGDRVIRPCKVVVNKRPGEPDPAAGSAEAEGNGQPTGPQ
jgi:molecular chaperone GrpE